jgi:protein involved in polysaccharide export with SLBB domain
VYLKSKGAYEDVNVLDVFEIKPYGKDGYEFEVIDTASAPGTEEEAYTSRFLMNVNTNPSTLKLDSFVLAMVNEDGSISYPEIAPIEIIDSNTFKIEDQEYKK